MNQEKTFNYNYSAKQNKEIQEIRNKYLKKDENKMEELRRLDRCVQKSGMVGSLCAGIGGSMVFGLGLCFVMQVLGSGAWFIALGIVIGIAGMIGMGVAYPVYRAVFNKTKAKYAPKILELTEELCK